MAPTRNDTWCMEGPVARQKAAVLGKRVTPFGLGVSSDSACIWQHHTHTTAGAHLLPFGAGATNACEKNFCRSPQSKNRQKRAVLVSLLRWNGFCWSHIVGKLIVAETGEKNLRKGCVWSFAQPSWWWSDTWERRRLARWKSILGEYPNLLHFSF